MSIQATVVYETSVDADPSGIVELKETNPCLFWHNLLRQKPAVWFTARNTWICLLGRQARPTYFVRLLCSIALILVSLKSLWLGCSRRIRTLSPGYGPSMLPLHHHCDISESLQYPRNLIPTSYQASISWHGHLDIYHAYKGIHTGAPLTRGNQLQGTQDQSRGPSEGIH